MPKKYKKINVKPTTNPDKIQIDIPSYLEKEKKEDKWKIYFKDINNLKIILKKRNQNRIFKNPYQNIIYIIILLFWICP